MSFFQNRVALIADRSFVQTILYMVGLASVLAPFLNRTGDLVVLRLSVGCSSSIYEQLEHAHDGE